MIVLTKLVLINLKGTRGFFSLSFLGKWTKTLKYRLRVLDPVFLIRVKSCRIGVSWTPLPVSFKPREEKAE